MPHPGTPLRAAALTLILCTGLAPAVAAQSVDAQLADLRRDIADMRSQLAEARREAADLRRELQALRDARSDDETLLPAKVEDLEQTKVDSGSKYHVRLSGVALLTASGTAGGVDNADLPTLAVASAPSQHSLVGGARQSSLRLEVFGPTIRGARTSAEASFDFFGGFPNASDGLSSALARLRTTSLSFDWPSTTIVVGQQTPFFSPLSPTSLLSSAYPAMSSAGNLWNWIPQVHVDRRVALGSSALLFQGGVLDALTGERPASEYEREPTAGERSGLPAPAARVGWQRGADRQLLAVGAGGYYARQSWGAAGPVNAWAATGDWRIPIGSRVALSGEVYRGRAIASLGASASPSVVLVASTPSNAITARPTPSAGGWSQVTLAASTRLELNAAIGTDRATLSPFATVPAGFGEEFIVRRNTTGFVNGIYQLRSNLLFSIEYRRLQTTMIHGGRATADHVSVGAGVGF